MSDLPRAPAQYDQRDQRDLRRVLKELFDLCYKKRENMEMDRSVGIIMTSPDGTRYKMTVANGGTTTWTAL